MVCQGFPGLGRRMAARAHTRTRAWGSKPRHCDTKKSKARKAWAQCCDPTPPTEAAHAAKQHGSSSRRVHAGVRRRAHNPSRTSRPRSGSRASRQRIRWHPPMGQHSECAVATTTRFPHPAPRGGWFPARHHGMVPRNGNSSRHNQHTTHGVLAAANTTGPAGLGPGRLTAKARRRGDLPAVTNQQHTEGTHQVGPCPRTPPLEKADD